MPGGRPPLVIGSYGNISTVEEEPGRWRASGRVRIRTGRTLPMRRWADTETKAIRRLKEAMVERLNQADGGRRIKPTTKFKVVAELFLKELAVKAANGKITENSARNYRGYVLNHLVPGLGDLQMLELDAAAIYYFLQSEQVAGVKADALSSERSVLSALCGFAIREKALDINPVRDVEPMGQRDEKEVLAFTLEQRKDVRLKLRERVELHAVDKLGRALAPNRFRVWQDLPDQVDGMLATGVRIGELLALDSDSWTTDRQGRPALNINYHIVRVTGKGLQRVRSTKSKADRLLPVPSWSVPMWERLALRNGPMFPAADGGWLDPSNTVKRISGELDAIGYDWATSHVFRKTVGSVIDQADGSSGDVARQLGNKRKTAERHYIAPRGPGEKVLDALESMWDEPDPPTNERRKAS
jgi:integrase